MGKEILRYWEHNLVDMTSATVPNRICILRGGESVTIKLIGSQGEYVYLGRDNKVSSLTGYKLAQGETVTFTLPLTFGRSNYIEIWGLTTSAGDDVCYFKLIGAIPGTEAST